MKRYKMVVKFNYYTEVEEELARNGLEWDISAEFIEDNDCYYVFMREI